MADKRNSKGRPLWTDGPPPRILVVDGADDTRLLYASYLSLAGIVVDEAKDGEEALALVAKSPPRVVILELTMPKMDGWEVTRLLKAEASTKDIRVIVVTSNAMPGEVARARAAGADEVLTKPCLPEKLLECVREVLGRR
jgi:two-component system cell cycle response regulator DivK